MDVRVRLGGYEMDEAEWAELGPGLQAILRDLDGVDEALVAGGPVPASAEFGELVTWDALVVSLASAGSFQVVLDVVASWLRRQPAGIEVEIEGQKLSGAVTREQRDALVQAFLASTGNRATEQPAERWADQAPVAVADGRCYWPAPTTTTPASCGYVPPNATPQCGPRSSPMRPAEGMRYGRRSTPPSNRNA